MKAVKITIGLPLTSGLTLAPDSIVSPNVTQPPGQQCNKYDLNIWASETDLKAKNAPVGDIVKDFEYQTEQQMDKAEYDAFNYQKQAEFMLAFVLSQPGVGSENAEIIDITL